VASAMAASQIFYAINASKAYDSFHFVIYTKSILCVSVFALATAAAVSVAS